MLVQAVVFLQAARIVRPQLAQRRIQKAPPRGRARPHQQQVLRTEQHGLEHALRVRLPLHAHAVFVYFHGFARERRSSSAKIAPLRVKSALMHAASAPKRRPSFFWDVRNSRMVEQAAAASSRLVLPLPVVPADQVDRRVEVKLPVLVVAELLERERSNVHSCVSPAFGCWLRSSGSGRPLPRPPGLQTIVTVSPSSVTVSPGRSFLPRIVQGAPLTCTSPPRCGSWPPRPKRPGWRTSKARPA